MAKRRHTALSRQQQPCARQTKAEWIELTNTTWSGDRQRQLRAIRDNNNCYSQIQYRQSHLNRYLSHSNNTLTIKINRPCDYFLDRACRTQLFSVTAQPTFFFGLSFYSKWMIQCTLICLIAKNPAGLAIRKTCEPNNKTEHRARGLVLKLGLKIADTATLDYFDIPFRNNHHHYQ